MRTPAEVTALTPAPLNTLLALGEQIREDIH
jgi:hypothetical protein